MGAAHYTPEEEARYRLPALPDVPPVDREEAERLNAEYEAQRRRYRELHPHAETKK